MWLVSLGAILACLVLVSLGVMVSLLLQAVLPLVMLEWLLWVALWPVGQPAMQGNVGHIQLPAWR